MLHIDKVTAFVTRGEGRDRELLVFQHPTAGIQLPAGTVELEETIEDAVIREVAEETGLTEITLVTKLATLWSLMEPDERMVMEFVSLRSEPLESADIVEIDFGNGLRGSTLRRGLTVRLLDTHDDYARVSYDVFDLTDEIWSIATSSVGWLPASSLTDDVRRHLFHLETTVEMEERWLWQADFDHLFACFWVPLSKDIGLTESQRAWLLHVFAQIADEE